MSMKRATLTSFITLAILVVSAGPAGAFASNNPPLDRSPKCGQAKTQTFYERGSMRLYLRNVTLTNFQTGGQFTGGRMYACSSKFRKGVALALCEFNYECFDENLVWDGRYLFYPFSAVAALSVDGTDVFIADLKTGASNGGVRLASQDPSAEPLCAGRHPCFSHEEVSFATGWGPNYVIAYEPFQWPYVPPGPTKSYAIEARCWSSDLTSQKVTILDRPGNPADLKSLKVQVNPKTKTNTAHWTLDGKKKSVAICR
jgi:hypothetical protein